MWDAFLGLGALAAVVVLPMAALFYGWKALAWGRRNHPRITGLIVLGLVLAPFVAAFTFGKLFPGCYAARIGLALPIGDCGVRH